MLFVSLTVDGRGVKLVNDPAQRAFRAAEPDCNVAKADTLDSPTVPETPSATALAVRTRK
jgi:hypothetical protein